MSDVSYVQAQMQTELQPQTQASGVHFKPWNSPGQGPPRPAQPRQDQGLQSILRRNTGLTQSSNFTRSGTAQILDESGDAWAKQNCLSLDGGGIRGYWSLLVLQKLMQHISEEEKTQAEEVEAERRRRVEHRSHNTRAREQATGQFKHSFDPIIYPPHVSQQVRVGTDRSFIGTGEHAIQIPTVDERFLPCHYFDYMCGSSTGALIAIMLSRFRMTVEDCMEEYKNLGGGIFGKPSKLTLLGIPYMNDAVKYKTEPVEGVFESFCRRRAESGRAPPIELRKERLVCKTCVTVMAEDIPSPSQDNVGIRRVEIPTALRSYDPHENFPAVTDIDRTWRITEVARAATAAPLFFEEVKIPLANRGTRILKDAGLGPLNNPALFIVDEVQRLHSTSSGGHNLGLVVSVGTSRKDGTRTGTICSRIKAVIDAGADPEATHRNVLARSQQENFEYFRFNDPGRLAIPLDDWRPRSDVGNKKSGHKTIDEIENAFARWYAKKRNYAPFTKCARQLVARRRQRTVNRELWDRYAAVSYYKCKERMCSGQRFELKSEFQQHWISNHGDPDQDYGEEDLEDVFREHREQWNYQEGRGTNRQ